MGNVRINADEVVRAKAFLRYVNTYNVSDVEWVNDASEIQIPPVGEQFQTVDDFEFVGLNTSDFVENVLYWDGMEEVDEEFPSAPTLVFEGNQIVGIQSE